MIKAFSRDKPDDIFYDLAGQLLKSAVNLIDVLFIRMMNEALLLQLSREAEIICVFI